ncbi:MAG TPA: hypothetical protein VHK66_01780 [Microvirga sp.]|nr:hypothetical protein [Microvirga sp.]
MSVMVRWLLVIPFALLAALAAGSLFFLIVAVADPVMAELAGKTLFVGFWSLMDAIVGAENPDAVVLDALTGVGRLTLMVFVLPPVFVALVGNMIGLRGLVWYTGATGLLAAAMPWLLRGSPRVTTPDELRVSLLLGLTGAVAGFVYWLIACRGAGAARASG